MLKRIGWSEPQVDADMHLKQCRRHLSSADMVLHSFFGNCIFWLFHVLFLWTWSCIHSLEIEFSDCSNSSMEFYRVLCASGIQLDLLQKNRLVGASSECRDALKAILATSFFCRYGLALILWRLFCDCSMLCRGCPWTWNFWVGTLKVRWRWIFISLKYAVSMLSGTYVFLVGWMRWLRWHWDDGFFHVKDRVNLKQLCAGSFKMSSFLLKEQLARSYCCIS